MRAYRRLQRAELPTQTVELAQALIGLVVVHDENDARVAGKIVETEAYVLRDPASHAFRGKSARNASMFLAPFHAYVYKIYGTSFCLNVTSEEEMEGAAVLVRALEPLQGIDLMAQRRKTNAIRDLCRGPGRLCKALNIDRSLDGIDLISNADLWLARTGSSSPHVRKSKRIGITKAAQRHLRFYEADSSFISGPRHLSP